jgi:hypothetical protein
MGDDRNRELREEREEQQEHRQELRDESFDADGGVSDVGSQDERRHEGLGRA